MTNERRYTEDEVRKIFKLATTDKHSDVVSPTTAAGLTLNEIQSIGAEVGIEPAMVVRAAVAFDTQPAQHSRKSLGMPVQVGLTVPLPRAMTDLEWDQLVGELRGTFNARGSVAIDGNLREWRNSKLHAAVEPTTGGYRLRLGTTKGNAIQMNAIGATALLGSAVMVGMHFILNDPTSMAAPMALAAAGIGAFIANWIRLPPWAQRREDQMRHVAAKAQSIVGGR